MGLDSAELVMNVEDVFGITISDSDASEMCTVGDLVSLCIDRIHAAKTMQCPVLACFLSLRQLVRDIRNDPDFRIGPRDKVEERLNESERQLLWRRLPDLLQTAPRELQRPPWVRRLLVLVVLGFLILLMCLVPWQASTLLLIVYATYAFGMILNWLTIGSRILTPDGYGTFGEIAKRIVGLNMATNPPDNSDYGSVFSIVRRIIIEQLGVDEDEVVPTARFIEDLGVG